MGKHIAQRRGGLRAVVRSTRVRSVLALGVLLGFGSVSTFAYWTDSATVTGGTFVSGTLDIKVNGSEGKPTAYPWTVFSLDNMVPGESVAAALTVQNTGTVDFTYTAMANGSGDLLPYMQFAVYVGGGASNPVINGLRTGSCSGASIGVAKVLTGTAQDVIPTDRNLAKLTGSESVCVVAQLPSSAPSAAQGKTAGATFVFNAKQIGAP